MGFRVGFFPGGTQFTGCRTCSGGEVFAVELRLGKVSILLSPVALGFKDFDRRINKIKHFCYESFETLHCI